MARIHRQPPKHAAWDQYLVEFVPERLRIGEMFEHHDRERQINGWQVGPFEKAAPHILDVVSGSHREVGFNPDIVGRGTNEGLLQGNVRVEPFATADVEKRERAAQARRVGKDQVEHDAVPASPRPVAPDNPIEV
jgi:hypothetical protein